MDPVSYKISTKSLNNTKETQGGMREMKSQESKGNSAGNAKANDSPARLDNGRVGQAAAQIPGQVADTVHAVVGERQGQGGLQEDLGSDGESGHSSNHGGRLKVQAKSRGGEVGSGPQVEGTGQGDTGDTVQGGADPADLGLVDSQMGGDRAVQALLSQDLGRVLLVGGRSDGSRWRNDCGLVF